MDFSETSLLSLLRIVYKWRKQLLLLVAAAFVLSAGFSLLMPTYYRAYTKALPSSPLVVMPNAIFGNDRLAPYGDADDLDRIQNFANSGELTDFLIKKFDLYKHYGIDSSGERARNTIGLHMEKLYTVAKDQFGGVEIAVEDRDPKMAAALANAAIERVSEMDRTAATANLKSMLETYEALMMDNIRTIDSFSTHINRINRMYKYPSIALRREILVQASPGMSVDAQLGLLQRAGRVSGDSLAAITENLYIAGVLDSRRAGANAAYIETQTRHTQAKKALESNVRTLQIIERAVVPDVKSRPKRFIVVLTGVFFALLAGIVGVIVLEQYKNVPWRKIFETETN